MSQLPATRTLSMGVSTATNDLYVLSHIGPRYRGMFDITYKDIGKKESK
jgi:hypothetical protein